MGLFLNLNDRSGKKIAGKPRCTRPTFGFAATTKKRPRTNIERPKQLVKQKELGTAPAISPGADHPNKVQKKRAGCTCNIAWCCDGTVRREYTWHGSLVMPQANSRTPPEGMVTPLTRRMAKPTGTICSFLLTCFTIQCTDAAFDTRAASMTLYDCSEFADSSLNLKCLPFLTSTLGQELGESVCNHRSPVSVIPPP